MEANIILGQRARGISRSRLQHFARRACGVAGLKGAVTVLLTDNREMRRLNSRFRGKRQATDVLSFPAPASSSGFAGDIAISVEIASQNARALGHATSREVEILLLHGILHLAGYDHENDRGEMAMKEALLRSKLALPTGLIERSSMRKPTQRARP